MTQIELWRVTMTAYYRAPHEDEEALPARGQFHIAVGGSSIEAVMERLPDIANILLPGMHVQRLDIDMIERRGEWVWMP